MIPAIRSTKAGATLKLWETETPCGGGRGSSCGTGPGTKNNSWAWGQSQLSIMRSFLESGVSVYSQWNMVLDQTGRSGWGWSQCSPVTIDTVAQTVTYEGVPWLGVDAGVVQRAMRPSPLPCCHPRVAAHRYPLIPDGS